MLVTGLLQFRTLSAPGNFPPRICTCVKVAENLHVLSSWEKFAPRTWKMETAKLDLGQSDRINFKRLFFHRVRPEEVRTLSSDGANAQVHEYT
jgi:hypothetical protein